MQPRSTVISQRNDEHRCDEWRWCDHAGAGYETIRVDDGDGRSGGDLDASTAHIQRGASYTTSLGTVPGVKQDVGFNRER